jgi:large subunit ribosomal protein L29
MKSAKMRELTKEELAAQCLETQKELFNLRIRKGTGTIEQPSRLRVLRREIARMRTILRERA